MTTRSPLESLLDLCRRDKRFKLQAYVFLSEAMDFAHRKLGLGAEKPSEPLPPQIAETDAGETEDDPRQSGKHVTGQQLCEAIRLYALEQYGLLAKSVLNSWGVTATGDFGDMVYNLIRIGQMRKTSDDRREDFDGVFDFETGFNDNFTFQVAPREES